DYYCCSYTPTSILLF
nr:immunoglobulin light chain junction region [Macaca mulatta]MOX31074.1 immunoglobulin light chain junction region [Macaca mulatta]MOX31798.1 immunoglobulin light chain junction region [Macaca mulatta]